MGKIRDVKSPYTYREGFQPPMGLKQWALLLPFQRPVVSMLGPVNDGVMRQLHSVGPFMTVPTNAVPVNYILGAGTPYYGTAGNLLPLSQMPDPRDF